MMTYSNLLKKIVFLMFYTSISIGVFADSNKILITEFMAINSKALEDDDGDYPDWIEIYNPGENNINLSGWYLTDKSDNLIKWEFPNITLNANEYLVVFASEKKRNDPLKTLHTNFKLSGSGEFLAIVEPDGTTISHSYGDVYPAQREDISYGYYEGQYVFFDQPTPGSDNVLGNLVPAPQFSHTRGFYDEKIDVTLTGYDSGTKIYYTTNGTRPSATTGTLYSAPIEITTTTPLSAVSINNSGVASEIISHTYLFIESIVQQPNNPQGYPSTWGKFLYQPGYSPADYEMDPEICNHTDYKDLMDDALTSIPSLSIVTNIGYLFSNEKDKEKGGIYVYTADTGDGGVGKDWERPCSVEYFDPESNLEFQINCGVRLHGGNSRKPDNSPKHSLRLSFRSIYGPSKLNFNFFEEKSATNEFNALVLRSGYNYSWIKNDEKQRKNTQYLQDPFAKTTQLAIGQVSPHERFVHLYLNGLYWGVYNVSEKLTNDFMESYLKGSEDDFDVVKDHGGTVDGSFAAWSRLYQQSKLGLTSNTSYQKIQGKNPDGSINPAFENLLDVENLIGYMQYNMYIGNEDWDHNNWIAARNRVTNEAGFRFFCWDAETSLTDVNANMVDENNDENPSFYYQKLKNNPEFKLLFADNIQKNFFNGGPLSPEAAIERYTKLADEIDLAIIAESARWGDYRKDVDPSDDDRILYTRNNHWLPRKEDLIQNYFPYRTNIVVQQFKNIGLFPNIEAPTFSHQGGVINAAINLGMTSNYGEIYYTTDGSDPREPITSNITPIAKLYSSEVNIASKITIKARAKSGNQWSPITVAKYKIGDPTLSPSIVMQEDLLSGNYPNPFKESTKIFFTLPTEGNVQVDIIGIDGRIISNVYDGFMPSGYNTVDWNPQSNERGLFLYKIKFNDKHFFGKILRH